MDIISPPMDSLKIAPLILIVISGCNIFGADDNFFEVGESCNYTPITQTVQSEEDLYGFWTLSYHTSPAWTNGCEKIENRDGFRINFLNSGKVEKYRNDKRESESDYTTELISGCGYLHFTSSIDSLIVDSSPCDGGKLLYLRDSR